jgi:MFS family permease
LTLPAFLFSSEISLLLLLFSLLLSLILSLSLSLSLFPCTMSSSSSSSVEKRSMEQDAHTPPTSRNANPAITPANADIELAGEKRRNYVSDTDNSPYQSESPVNDNTKDEIPITYRYLTFETELPTPILSSVAEQHGAGASTLDPESGKPQPQPISQSLSKTQSRLSRLITREEPRGPPPCPDLTPYTSPFLWSLQRKRFTTYLSCCATVVTAYCAGSYAPPAATMSLAWSVSEVAVLAGITTFCAGFGIAPMVLAPFSEINGRYPVFITSGVIFVICQVCCAITKSYAGMLLARFFVGVGSSVFSTMVGGVISDIWHTNERNTPMALFSGAALFGTGLGPLVSGFIAQNEGDDMGGYGGWRWVFWVQVVMDVLLVSAFALLFKETRGSVLLSRKAGVLNQWYEAREAQGYYGVLMPGTNGEKGEVVQRLRWKVKSDEERQSLKQMIAISLYRPFHLLLTEPVVFFFSLWVSFSWAVLYLTFAAIPLVFTESYGFNIQQTGAVFGAMCIGALISTFISIYQEKVLAWYLARHTDSNSRIIRRLRDPGPETRLYFVCAHCILLPIGLFWFGWTQFSNIPWIVPTLAIGCATMGIFSIYLGTFNYLADTYHRYASSALAAQSFCRNIMGGIFPLFDRALFMNVGFAGASSLLGGIGVLLTLVPWILAAYGPRIRARSKFASVSCPVLIQDSNSVLTRCLQEIM